MRNPYKDEPTVTYFDFTIGHDVISDHEGSIEIAGREMALVLGYDDSFVDFIPYHLQKVDGFGIKGRMYYCKETYLQEKEDNETTN